MDTKDTYTEVFLRASGIEYNTDDILKLKKQWWYNLRSVDSAGLRLTDDGIDFIENKAQIKKYKIEFPKEFTVTPQILLWLDKFIDSPYYIDKKSITVFKEKSAF